MFAILVYMEANLFYIREKLFRFLDFFVKRAFLVIAVIVMDNRNFFYYSKKSFIVNLYLIKFLMKLSEILKETFLLHLQN